MLLSLLVKNLKELSVTEQKDADIVSVETDSKSVKIGSLFVCLKGANVDGHDYAAAAVKNGAVCIVSERKLDLDVRQIVVSDTHQAISILAQNFYENAIDSMKLICVVGTNGKTSTAILIDSILREAGYHTGLITTNGIWTNEKFQKNDMTTPDPLFLNSLFREMKNGGVHFVTMEVSAHAIAQQKLYGIKADLTVFTNFSQDHLDYFENMENYKKTKKSFFNRHNTKIAVLNVDDFVGREIAAETDVPVVTYGLDSPADVFAIDVESEGNSSSYILNIYDEIVHMKYNLTGRFNAYNTLAAATVCRVFGIKPQTISQGIVRVKYIEGRNQAVSFPKGFKVVVDFAHTPEGIENILSYLSSATFGKVITVFGCGGNRDKTKRPLMAEAVSKYSDYAYVTSDNPRGEDPFEIMFQTEKGLSINHEIVCDRKLAIIKAIGRAEQDDTVVILGKGHEKYQEINGVKYPFNDLDIVLESFSSNSLR